MDQASQLYKYKGKRVFVTGHTGFKGSWLIAWLHLLGAQVKGYALAPEHKDGIYNCIVGDTLCDSIIGDIRNEAQLTEEIIAFQPDFIFHLAAQPLVRLSYSKPTETFEVNVIGTANLLNALRNLKSACTTVVITTDKVYENKEWSHPYREADKLGGYDPYSASKACTELVVDSFRNSFFNITESGLHRKGIAAARAGNVIGGGDWSLDRLVPDIIKNLKAGKPVEVRSPNAIRPWQFVLEPLLGYLELGLCLSENIDKFSEAYNFGPYPHDFLSVGTVVDRAVKCWGSGEVHYQENTNQLHEAGILKLDISKAIDQLKWLPRLNSGEAIEWTIDWYKQEIANQQEFTFQQIKKYQSI